MYIMRIISIVLFMFAALWHIILIDDQHQNVQKKDKDLFIKISKALLMPLLLLVYYLYAVDMEKMLVAAILCGWIGDIILVIKHDEPVTKANLFFFAGGLVFFLIGHLCYISMFLQCKFFELPDNYLLVLLYLSYLLYVVIFCAKIIKKESPGMLKIGLLVYSLTVSTLSFAALSFIIFKPSFGTLLIYTGSLFFISSDSLLGIKKIGGKHTINEQYIMITYLTAQLLIVLGWLKL